MKIILDAIALTPNTLLICNVTRKATDFKSLPQNYWERKMPNRFLRKTCKKGLK